MEYNPFGESTGPPLRAGRKGGWEEGKYKVFRAKSIQKIVDFARIIISS